MPKKPVKPDRRAKRPWIGAWIRDYLAKSGITQGQLAGEWGKDQSLVSKIILGRADLDAALWQNLSDRTGIPIEDFLNGPKPKPEILLGAGVGALVAEPSARYAETSPSEADWWMARRAVDGALKKNGLEKAAPEQRELMAKHLAQSASMGATGQELEQELQLFLDMIRAALGHKGSK